MLPVKLKKKKTENCAGLSLHGRNRGVKEEIMKKVFRNLFAALTAAALIGSFASCSDGDSGNDNEEQKVQPADKSKAETKTLTLKKNEYAATPQTQIKLNTGFDSLQAGDKVSVVLKGTADKALGKAEIIVCDTTEAANWWKNLADPYSCEIDTEFDISAEFTITENPVGSGAESMTLAINGLEDDKTVTLTCTKYLVQKGGLDTIAKEPEAKEPEVKEPVVEAETVVYEGTTELEWGKREPEVALADKDFTGLKITYTATSTEGMCFKLLDTSWGAFEVASVTGDGSLRAADAADDPLKAVDLTKTEGVVTVNFAAATVESVKAGLGFQGAPGVTITKIALVK